MGATMKDIARITGLSIATVSKCINGHVIKEENRALIEKTIEELGYVRDESARSMKTGRSGFIAIVVPTLEIPMVNVFVRECRALLTEKDLTPIICVCENDEKREQYIISKLEANQVDGMIIMPVSRDTTKAYDYLKNHNLPFVFFDQFIPTYPSDCVALCVDAAIDELMHELKELGHEHIGVMLGSNPLSSFDRRASLINTYAKKHGLSCPDEYMIYGCSGFDSVRKIMNLSPAPTAIICLSEDATIGAFIGLYGSGYRIPHDISLVGVRNDSYIDNIVSMEIALLDQPTKRCAEACVSTLYEKLMLKYDKQSVSGASKRVDINVKFRRGKTIGQANKIN